MSDASALTGTIIVAGGSGGIGRAICRSLGKAGANVALSYRSNNRRQSILRSPIPP